MSQTVTHEREKYEQMWALPAYAAHSPGETLVPVFQDLVERHGGPASQWRIGGQTTGPLTPAAIYRIGAAEIGPTFDASWYPGA